MPSDRANGLPHSYGIRVPIPIVLHIGGEPFDAGLRATTHNNYVWICPDMVAKDGTKKRLADIAAKAGFKKNDRVYLAVDGRDVVLKLATQQ